MYKNNMFYLATQLNAVKTSRISEMINFYYKLNFCCILQGAASNSATNKFVG